MGPQTAHEIDQAAADWAAKVDRGLSADERSAFDVWLAGDARRLGAYGRMRAIALQTERVAALNRNRTSRTAARAPAPDRRRLLFAGGAAAAAILGVGTWASVYSGRFQTGKGEVRQLALEDGSVVTLNTESTISVTFTAHRREVRLLHGEALFDVASDKARPFVVLAGSTETRAVGTSFIVRRLKGEAIQVLVREGVVEVARSAAITSARVRLEANMRATGPTAPLENRRAAIAVTEMSQEEIHRALAWRDGRIAFEGETLGEAAAKFARYSDTRIVVQDSDLAREQIAGLYQANDPIGFARAAAASLRAEAEVFGGEVRIRKARVMESSR